MFSRFFVSKLSLEIILSQLPVLGCFETASTGCTIIAVYN